MQEFRIERLGHQGDGMVGNIRAPYTLPDELVQGTLTGNILTVKKLLETSPARVDAGCSRFGICGGCSLQHAENSFIAKWKADLVRNALSARDLETDIRPVISSPPGSRRRAVFSGRRTRKTVTVGFHGRRSEAVGEISGCIVLDPHILSTLPLLQALTRAGASRSGEIRITVLSGPSGQDIAVEDARLLDLELHARLSDLISGTNIARLSWNGEVVMLARSPFQQFGPAQVVPPPGSFLQATAEGEQALVRTVTEIVGDAQKVVDLFAGCGTFSLPLAANASVHAVEGEAGMTEALDAGWRGAKGLHQVSTETRDLFRRPLLQSELNVFDCAVVDPPRAGAEAQTHEIADSGIERVASVSCNPVTFARDAQILVAAGFSLDWVQPVDQFLWTGHVELVASFSR